MANTTADKLAKLNATKADLKAALAEKGQTVGDVFSTYPAAVRAIETGPKTANVDFGTGIQGATYHYVQNGVVKTSYFSNEFGDVQKIDLESILVILNIPNSTFSSLIVSGGITKLEDVSYSTRSVNIIYKVSGDGELKPNTGGSGGGSN